jgi:hypothetical protein
MKTLIGVSAGVLAATLFLATPGRAQDAHWWAAQWAEVAQQVAEFSGDRLPSRDGRPADRYCRARDRFGAVLAQAGQKNPPEADILRHWMFLPLAERTLAAMSMICQAATAGDAIGESVGWASFRDTIGLWREAMEAIDDDSDDSDETP